MAATPSQLTQWFESAQPTSSKGVNLEVLGNGCTMDTEAYTFPPSFLLQLWSICNWNYELFANDVHKATDLIGHQVEPGLRQTIAGTILRESAVWRASRRVGTLPE
eukprot:TRINITY_DN8645_c1_g1_i4.p1 TRINITY_DN8645_c1_g1~~TRINITY_DN8645_c1_g1_i4.p1  ORF type:complete len:106 (+),score=12.60 TRINITY_DN8645_c1_g1_i4:160-477(+)